MRVLGVLTTVLLGAAMAGFTVLAVRSVPDLKRYLAMRRM